jgi:hypothetical protein
MTRLEIIRGPSRFTEQSGFHEDLFFSLVHVVSQSYTLHVNTPNVRPRCAAVVLGKKWNLLGAGNLGNFQTGLYCGNDMSIQPRVFGLRDERVVSLSRYGGVGVRCGNASDLACTPFHV